MDFSNRNVQPQTAAPGAQNTAAGNFNKKNTKRGDRGKAARIITVVLVAVVAILIAAVIAVVVSSNDNTKAESNYVDSTKLQAVFLNTGQVYFGQIKSLNNDYLVLSDIYYLQTSNSGASGSNANSNVTLVKLGCELHEPYDQMVINSDQITFWENLQDNGQVAKAVSTFQKQNPNGQKCADQSSSASTNSSNNAQNAGNKSN
jgi:FlaG/FlaF family flagellin (archaellin)